MREKITLIESESPLCPVQAFAEQTDNAVWFYLFYPFRDQKKDLFEAGNNLKACWVCNCREAPDRLDSGDRFMMMPKGCFSHDPNGITVAKEGLHITWLADGNSAVLHRNGNVLAVIPPKAGLYAFPGFSRYAVGQNRYAWEMPEELRLHWMQQVADCDQLWEHSHAAGFWQSLQSMHLKILDGFFGKNTGYYAIDEGKYPLRAVIEGKKNGVVYGFTAFLSLFQQPEIEVYIKNGWQHSRIEFGFAAAEHLADKPKIQAYNCFMALAKYIYRDTVFFAHGHTNTWDGIPGFHAFLFLNARAIEGMESPQYPKFMGDPINLLWAVPITKAEYDFAVQNGSGELLQRAKDLSRVHIFDGMPKFSL